MPDEPVFPPSPTPGASIPVPPPPPPPSYPAGTSTGVPGGAGATTLGLEPNIAAGLAVIFPPISSIIFLVLEKRSHLVRFWAMQSLILVGALFLFNIATWIIGFVFAHIPVLGWFAGIFLFLLSMAVGIGAIVLYVIMLIKAFTGVEWEMPVVGQFARQQLAKMPV